MGNGTLINIIPNQYQQPIRLLLAYAGVEYEDKRYKTEERDAWMNEKHTLGLDFPNVSVHIALVTKQKKTIKHNFSYLSCLTTLMEMSSFHKRSPFSNTWAASMALLLRMSKSRSE